MLSFWERNCHKILHVLCFCICVIVYVNVERYCTYSIVVLDGVSV